MKYMSEFDESRPTESLYDDERHQRMPLRVHFCGSSLHGPTSRFFPLPESSSKSQALKRRANKSTELVSAKRRRFQPSSCKSAQISRQSARNGNCPSAAMCTDEDPSDAQMMDCKDDNNNNNINNNNSTRSKRGKRGTRNDSSSEDDDCNASRSRSALSRGTSRSLQRNRRLKSILKRSKRRRRRRGSKRRRRVRFNKKVMVRRVSRDGH